MLNCLDITLRFLCIIRYICCVIDLIPPPIKVMAVTRNFYEYVLRHLPVNYPVVEGVSAVSYVTYAG